MRYPSCLLKCLTYFDFINTLECELKVNFILLRQNRNWRSMCHVYVYVCVIMFKWKDKTSATISLNLSNNLHWTWTWYLYMHALTQVRHMFTRKAMLSAFPCCYSPKRRKQFVKNKNNILQKCYCSTLKFSISNLYNFLFS